MVLALRTACWLVAIGVVLAGAVWLLVNEPDPSDRPIAPPPESSATRPKRVLPTEASPVSLLPDAPGVAQQLPGATDVARLRLRASRAGAESEVELMALGRRDEPHQTQRQVRLTVSRLVVVVLNGAGAELWRMSVVDPRIVRAEFFATDGPVEEARTLARDAETTVAFPHHPDARALVVYQPLWSGSDFDLREVGTVTLHDPQSGQTP